MMSTEALNRAAVSTHSSASEHACLSNTRNASYAVRAVATLLSRDQFRDAVFERDKHQCVLCGAPAVDAHHVIERRLWSDGGYYIDNGASVCAACHLRCERTEASVEEVRAAAGIRTVVVPPGFDAAEPIDKWGNPLLPNGMRMRGPLFVPPDVDVGLQNLLAHVEFTSWVKYPRTPHLPWSPGATADDTWCDTEEYLDDGRNRPLVVTRKMDGECTSLYRDGLHARSLNTRGGPERDWLKAFHAGFAHDIPEGWRICGESLFARHSIAYDDLESYFLVFSIWDETNTCLAWDEVEEWCNLLGLAHVPVLYRGPWDETKLKSLVEPDQEGYVVRSAGRFQFSRFRDAVAKYVRANHVQTDQHWKHQRLVPNKLAAQRSDVAE